jgi:hypothetical protein
MSSMREAAYKGKLFRLNELIDENYSIVEGEIVNFKENNPYYDPY